MGVFFSGDHALLTEYVGVDDLPSFAGTLYCSSDEGCSLFPVAVNNNFSGVYGTGRAVEAAASVASGSGLRRSRRLVRGNPERSEVDPALLDAADTDRFLRTRLAAPGAIAPWRIRRVNRGAGRPCRYLIFPRRFRKFRFSQEFGRQVAYATEAVVSHVPVKSGGV